MAKAPAASTDPSGNRVISIITRLAVSLALVIVAGAVAWALFNTREVPVKADTAQRSVRVQVIEARPTEVRRQWIGFGTARAMDSASVPAQVRGVIAEVPGGIMAGATVERGQLLARVDDADIRHEAEITNERIAEINAQLNQLEVERETWQARLELLREEVELARADLERFLSAREAAGALQREVDQARQALTAARRNEINAIEQVERIEPRRAQLRATLAQQQSSLRLALRNLERTEIVSPLDGVLQTVDVEEGESVSVDQLVARVVSLRRIEIPLRIPASARPSLAVGGEVVLGSSSSADDGDSNGPDGDVSARIARIAPVDDASSRTTTIYVELLQDPAAPTYRGIAPGQFVRGAVTAASSERRWIVPRRSIQGAPSGRIRLVENGTAVSIEAIVDFQVRGEFSEFGVPDTLWAVLRNPLPEGALVVVDAARSLPEGTRVEPVRNGTSQQAGEDESPNDSAPVGATPAALGPALRDARPWLVFLCGDLFRGQR